MQANHHTVNSIEWSSLMTIHDEFEARYWSRELGLPRSEVKALFGRLRERTMATARDDEAAPLSIASLLKKRDEHSTDEGEEAADQ